MANILRQRLQKENFLLGSHINGIDPTMTECMGQCGIDYICIDTEHTAIDYQTLQMHLIAARAANCPTMVRIPWNEGYLAKRVLEMGPDAIIFPMIRSVEEARRAIASCQYPPKGDRSFGPIRAANYGAISPKDFAEKVDTPCCFLQVEHIDAVNAIDEILAVPGLDGIILGPCDLSGSMHILGDLSSPALTESIDYVIEKCNEYQIPVGVSLGLGSDESLLNWRKKAIQFASIGNEYSFIQKGLAQLKHLLRK